MSPEAEPPAEYVLAPAPEPLPIAVPVEPATVGNAPSRLPRVGFPRRAFTPPVFVSAGYIASFVGGQRPATGHGVEASLIAHSSSEPGESIGLGPVLQLQNCSDPNHLRAAAGLELAWMIGGLDVLYAYRAEAGGHAGTSSSPSSPPS